MKKFNAIYGQSGGPTCVINSSAYGLIKELRKYDCVDKIFCMHHGIYGLLKEDIIDTSNLNDNYLETLKNTPGAAFGSNRFKLKTYKEDKDTYKKLFEILEKYNIRYFFYNGGNDSMDTINKISNYARKINYELYAIGIPKTIDNDLCAMDHTPGYGSAIKFIANAVSSIYFDDLSYEKGRVNIVEIMGRDTGFLTAGSKLAELNGAVVDLIYVPEKTFDIDEFLKDVNDIYQKKNRCLICISEGIKDANNNLIATAKTEKDNFGHEQLGGVSVFLSNLVTKKLNMKSRYFELSLLQRSMVNYVSDIDQEEAINCGKFAAIAAINKKTGKIVAISRNNDSKEYQVTYNLICTDKVALKVKYLSDNYINKENNNVTQDFIDYAKPLLGSNPLLKVFKLN